MSYNADELNEISKKIATITDTAKFVLPTLATPKIGAADIQIPDLEDTIIGDIKREMQAQNELATQQIGLLVKQNSLLLDNYDKLKSMYETQTVSYRETRDDLEKSRVFNRWMMVIAIVAMLAAIAGPIVTAIVS